MISPNQPEQQDAEKGETAEVFQPRVESPPTATLKDYEEPSYQGKRFLMQSKSAEGVPMAAHQELGKTRTFLMDFNVYRYASLNTAAYS